MKTKELIEYLQQYDGDQDVGVIITNIEANIGYTACAYELVKTDELEFPVIMIDTNGIKPFSEVIDEAKG